MDILMMALLSCVAQLAAHYLPWRRLLGRQLRRTEAYTIGVVLMLAPFSVWLGLQGLWRVLLALWIVIAACGAVVIGAYGLDHYLETVQRLQADESENRSLRGMAFDDENDKRS